MNFPKTCLCALARFGVGLRALEAAGDKDSIMIGDRTVTGAVTLKLNLPWHMCRCLIVLEERLGNLLSIHYF